MHIKAVSLEQEILFICVDRKKWRTCGKKAMNTRVTENTENSVEAEESPPSEEERSVPSQSSYLKYLPIHPHYIVQGHNFT